MAKINDNKVFIGSEIKLNISIQPLGDLTMDDYDFEVETFCSPRKVVLTKKSDAIKVDENNYVVLVDTDIVGAGDLKCKITAYIPDADFDDGLRTEVAALETGVHIIKSI